MPNDFHFEGTTKAPSSIPGSGPKVPWLESCLELAVSRIAIFQHEAKEAAAKNVGRIIMLVAAILAIAVTWLLLVTAGIGIISAYTPMAWYWTSLCVAGIHLLAAIALLRSAKTPSAPSFKHTRAEFKKDREWFQSLQQPKSKH